RILLFQSLFVFSENIQRDKGVCFLWTYGDCSRRFALVSGPATGLIVGPGPHFYLFFFLFLLFSILYLFSLSKMPPTLWERTKGGSKKGFDKTWQALDKLGDPVNRLSYRLGAEAFWPMTL